MEGTIHDIEKRVAALTIESENPKIMSNSSELGRIMRELSSTQAELDRLYGRWAELEEMMKGQS